MSNNHGAIVDTSWSREPHRMRKGAEREREDSRRAGVDTAALWAPRFLPVRAAWSEPDLLRRALKCAQVLRRRHGRIAVVLQNFWTTVLAPWKRYENILASHYYLRLEIGIDPVALRPTPVCS